MNQSYEMAFQGMRILRPVWPTPKVEALSDYSAEIIEAVLDFNSDRVQFGTPILKHSVQCLINGVHQGTDNGKGGFNQPDKSDLVITWIDYERGEIQYRNHGLSRHDHVVFLASVQRESMYDEDDIETTDLFNCKCCGAPQQRRRCFYCRSFPNVKER